MVFEVATEKFRELKTFAEPHLNCLTRLLTLEAWPAPDCLLQVIEKLPEDQAGPADAELDVAELSSLYLGGVAARTLVDAGRIEARDAAAAARFAAVFDVSEPPQCSTSF